MFVKLFPYLTILICSFAHAEITTDGSLGAAQHLTGPQFQIPQNLGTTIGNNLFHSFAQFNLQAQESAIFTGTDTLKNVISRVTGGTLSTIDGLLKSEIGLANFYFINPAGITFGANAKVDVPAAFYLSTADSLHFSDGSQLNTSLASTSSLSIADPISFGFLANHVGTIQIQHSNLSFKPESHVSLSASDITIEQSRITNSHGVMQLSSTGYLAAEIKLNQLATEFLSGNTTITDSRLDSGGNGGGRLLMDSGGLTLNNSTLSANNSGAIDADLEKGIFIQAHTMLIENKSFITANAYATGNAGSLTLTGDKLELLSASELRSDTYAQGNANQTLINVKDILINRQNTGSDTGIFSDAHPSSTGNAGLVSINSDKLTLLTGGEISSNTDAIGNAGEINVLSKEIVIDGMGDNTNITGFASDASPKATGGHAGNISVGSDRLTISNGGQITSDTHSAGNAGTVTVNSNNLSLINAGTISSSARAGSGNAGNVEVNAKNTLINGHFNPLYTGIFSDTYKNSTGAAGTVKLTGTDLTLLNLGQISSSTWSQNTAGDVLIETGNLFIDGKDSGIFAAAHGLGQSGDLDINVSNTVKVSNLGKISIENTPVDNVTNPQNATSTPPGELTIITPILELDNGMITAKVTGSSDAGSVTINATQSLTAKNHATINSSTLGVGSAGKITVTTPLLALNNADISSEAALSSGGQTNDVSVRAAKGIYLTNGSRISMKNDAKVSHPDLIRTTGLYISAPIIDLSQSSFTTEATENVDAGQINIDFSQQLQMNAAFITTAAKTGNGGDISVNGGQWLNLHNSGLLTSVAAGQGNGGKINVATAVLILNSGVIQANAVSGTGGDINLQLQALIPSHYRLLTGGAAIVSPVLQRLNVIQAASANGVSGNISISAPQFNISGSIIGLDANKLALPTIDRSACQASLAQVSSLVRSGKSGLPLNEEKTGFIPAAAVPELPTNSESSVISPPQQSNPSCQKQ